MVRDGDAMSATGQIVQHMFRSAKAWLSIHDPVLLNERAQKGSEVLLLGQRVGGRNLDIVCREEGYCALYSLPFLPKLRELSILLTGMKRGS
jgi:hypothetical protein